MLERIGSDYGGWTVDTAHVVPNSLVISAGLGNDISFDAELIRRFGCHVVGVDPTVLTQETVRKAKFPEDTFMLLRRAVWGEKDKTIQFDRSRSNGAGAYSGKQHRKVDAISLVELLAEYCEATLLKMNIEGGEYRAWLDPPADWSVPRALKQILVRFHHRKAEVPFDVNATRAVVHRLRGMGFETVFATSANDKDKDKEVCFVR
jgi:hypothetical protein